MARALAFLLMAVASALFVARTIDVRTAITDFLPRDEQTSLLELARELAVAPQSRVVVFTLAVPDEARRDEAVRAFAARLRASGVFAWVRSGLSETDQSALYELFFPARFGLLDMPEGTGPVPDAFLDGRIEAMRERLGGPLSVVERRLAPEDPLGGFADLITRQARGRGKLQLVGDQLVSEDGRYTVLFAATRASPFDAAEQSKVERAVADARTAARALVGDVALEWSGVNRYALASERSVRADIERISTLSVVGIFLLYFLVFRSLRESFLVLLPIGFGCLVATAVCQLAFGFVHGLALAFGSAIIGVAEDYSTHYLTHRAAEPAEQDNEQLMQRLWPGMLIGGVTTIIGIAMLFLSGFPGLQQMAVFGAVGVFGALAATRYLLPPLARRGPRAGYAASRRFNEWVMRGLSARPGRVFYLLFPPLALAVIGLPQLRFDDRVASLKTPVPEIEEVDRRISARLGRGAPGRVVIAVGATDDEALARAEAARGRLEEARRAGELGNYRSVADLLPSAAVQTARVRRLQDDPTLIPRVRAALARHGFVPAAFAPFEAALSAPPAPITAEALRKSALADLIAPFRAPLAHGVAYLTPIEDGRHDLTDRLRGLEGVYYLDQEALFSAAYGRFRTRTISLLAVGLLLVLAVLFARYRSMRVSALGMLPALLGTAAALSVEALRGVPASMMHVIGALLVLSMGVDFGIYALESRGSIAERATTLAGMLLAALTTVLSFGLLGLSENPALAAIGATVGFGMVFTVFASPLVFALTRSE